MSDSDLDEEELVFEDDDGWNGKFPCPGLSVQICWFIEFTHIFHSRPPSDRSQAG